MLQVTPKAEKAEKAAAEEDEDATDSDVNDEKHVPDHGTDSEGVVWHHVEPEDGTDSEDKDAADGNKVFFVFFCLVFLL